MVMALLLSMDSPFGGNVIDAYWKLSLVSVDWQSKVAKAELLGYVSRQARLDGKSPFRTEKYEWSGESFLFIGEEPFNERQMIYSAIKLPTLDENGNNINAFISAIDC